MKTDLKIVTYEYNKATGTIKHCTPSYILVEKHKNNIPTDSADWLWTILLKKT